MSGWFRRFRPSPPSAGLVPCPSTLRFSFPLPFQGLPAPGQVCCVGVLSFFFCVPLFASWLSISSSHLHGHLTFTPPSSSSIFTSSSVAPPCQRQGVCVCDTLKLLLFIYIYIYMRGVTGVPGGSVNNEDTSPGPCKCTRGTVVTHLGAFKTQLVVTIVPYIYIYIYIHSYLTNLVACYRTQFLPDHYNDPFLSSVCVVCDKVVLACCV